MKKPPAICTYPFKNTPGCAKQPPTDRFFLSRKIPGIRFLEKPNPKWLKKADQSSDMAGMVFNRYRWHGLLRYGWHGLTDIRCAEATCHRFLYNLCFYKLIRHLLIQFNFYFNLTVAWPLSAVL